MIAPAQCPIVFTRTGSWMLSRSGILPLQYRIRAVSTQCAYLSDNGLPPRDNDDQQRARDAEARVTSKLSDLFDLQRFVDAQDRERGADHVFHDALDKY